MYPSVLYQALASAILAGEKSVESIVERCAATLGREWPWLRPLAIRYTTTFADWPRTRQIQVANFLRSDPNLRKALETYATAIRVRKWLSPPPKMQPAMVARNWTIPPIETTGALADSLRLTVSELQWFAQQKRLNATTESNSLAHYNYRILQKRSGGFRLIEAPKSRLREIQRTILAEILNPIPVHPAVHGFRSGRSIRTFAAPHTGQRVVLRMDLSDFFATFTRPRIRAFFRTAGYPEPVADLLGGLCTHTAPRSLWSHLLDRLKQEGKAGVELPAILEAKQIYSQPHLPQGAPTSPSLSNICFYRIDCRLRGIADSVGAVYSRYADDLGFSGGTEFERVVDRFSTLAASILMEEGFRVSLRKTRVMRRGVRQHLAGLVLNDHVNIQRSDYDRLKAILTNCVRFGPESQNRDHHPAFLQHLLGRIAFIESIAPARGSRLRAIFDRIDFA